MIIDSRDGLAAVVEIELHFVPVLLLTAESLLLQVNSSIFLIPVRSQLPRYSAMTRKRILGLGISFRLS
jgi:hypothetical protein